MRERKLTDQQVAEIKALARTTMKKIDIARKFGVSPQLVSTVVKYGYTSRPTQLRTVKLTDEFKGWEGIARSFNQKNPDSQITGHEAKAIHDIAIKKIRQYWEGQGLTKQDLV